MYDSVVDMWYAVLKSVAASVYAIICHSLPLLMLGADATKKKKKLRRKMNVRGIVLFVHETGQGGETAVQDQF